MMLVMSLKHGESILIRRHLRCGDGNNNLISMPRSREKEGRRFGQRFSEEKGCIGKGCMEEECFSMDSFPKILDSSKDLVAFFRFEDHLGRELEKKFSSFLLSPSVKDRAQLQKSTTIGVLACAPTEFLRSTLRTVRGRLRAFLRASSRRPLC